MADVETVDGFKQHVKGLIKACKFKEAIAFANRKYEAECFSELQLREDVTLVHWWTKVYYAGSDLRSLTAKCLTKINTMINQISTCSPSTFKRADGETELTELEVDQCYAELLYLKRSIDTLIQFAV